MNTQTSNDLRTRKGSRQLSIVVPCYNEEQVIVETNRRLSLLCENIKDLTHQIIYVNDGSKDRTKAYLRQIQEQDPDHVKVVNLSRNFGHQAAVSAGIEAANGDAVVLIDADLQDPPEVIIEMVEKWRNGADVIYGVRTRREGESKFKLMTARTFYRLINRMSDTDIPLDTGDFRLMDRKVVDALCRMPERDRFIRGMVSWLGFNQVPVYYKRAARFAGETKYPLAKMIRFALDGILSFSTLPLKIASMFGLIISVLSVIGILYFFYLRLFTSNWVAGWTFMFVAILFIGGVQLVVLGIVGEYIGRIYGEVKRRPLYLIDEEESEKDRKHEIIHK